MTSKRDLGPLLAIAGGAIAIVAVIAGFIIIGGPGDARERRLDEMTIGRLNDVFNIVQCAYNGSKIVPASFADAIKAQGRIAVNEPLQPCNFSIMPENLPVLAGRAPPNPGDISYEATGPSSVKLCANFRRPLEAPTCNGICDSSYRGGVFQTARPAGIHCYDMDLTESELAPR
jgi:hypothetical protein